MCREIAGKENISQRICVRRKKEKVEQHVEDLWSETYISTQFTLDTLYQIPFTPT
jgi:hypothetical protein